MLENQDQERRDGMDNGKGGGNGNGVHERDGGIGKERRGSKIKKI